MRTVSLAGVGDSISLESAWGLEMPSWSPTGSCGTEDSDFFGLSLLICKMGPQQAWPPRVLQGTQEPPRVTQDSALAPGGVGLSSP